MFLVVFFGCVFVVMCLWSSVCGYVFVTVVVVVCFWLCLWLFGWCSVGNCVLRSGGEHWARMIVVEVRQGTLGADGRG